MKIIVIDPEADFLVALLAELLPIAPHIEGFTDWKSGWAAVSQRRPALLLVGLDVEGFEGFDPFEQLRPNATALVLLSEWRAFAHEAQRCGAVFLLKPVDKEGLENILKCFDFS